MDYEAEDKAIFEQITTDALKRVLAVCKVSPVTGHRDFSVASSDDIRLAVDGADIAARRAGNLMRSRFLAIRAALIQQSK